MSTAILMFRVVVAVTAGWNQDSELGSIKLPSSSNENKRGVS